MKTTPFPRTTALALFLAAALALVGCLDQEVRVTIQADGTCVVKNKLTTGRDVAEKYIRRMRAAEMEEVEDLTGEKPEPKPLTDETLTQAIRERFKASVFPESETELDAVTVEKDSVSIAYTLTYATVKDMVQYARGDWQEVGLDRLVIDRGEEGNLRLTFSSSYDWPDALRRSIDRAVLTGGKTTLRFVLPGKILTSSLPHTEENATWVSVDMQKEEDVEALRKLVASPVIITAEPGGLALEDLPYDSVELRRAAYERARPHRPEMKIPITDAGPGFLGEPDVVVTTTRYDFPEGKELLQKFPHRYGSDTPGVTVRGKLHAPRGRQFLALEEIRALKATDDKGRPVPIPEQSDYRGGGPSFTRYDEPQSSTSFTLSLGLPKPDAWAIEVIECQAVAMTFAQWRTLRIRPVKADPKKTIDLGDVLDGAKLAIVEVKESREEAMGPGGFQAQIALEVTGPEEVAQLDFEVSVPSASYGNAYLAEDDFKPGKDAATRTLTVTYHAYGEKTPDSLEGATLEARYPDQVRRERVKFTLEALDLF